VLLLVLILVLVAFGLLVVALLTGNVLSAWLSVAVSVAAAVVLVIDWLQRRSAVKAGKAGAESTSAPSPSTSHEDLDPVTEVLPVYSPESEEPFCELCQRFRLLWESFPLFRQCLPRFPKRLTEGGERFRKLRRRLANIRLRAA